ncbi:MSMEG_4193 family putative phosphomutase [Dermatobacter hominis]|uniref:MSMEG_4193 family putative phosphomutase n=1 Tax=Dermatobacter hominis TaxID=2884263 RepID=UPI001D10B449|nr:MSMEG_4193 family putative phosphomutase [Dermatobacter hominis]UDY37242.1 MSMEG_4193 family putative phosphomutase [Dermatobacter hominis]
MAPRTTTRSAPSSRRSTPARSGGRRGRGASGPAPTTVLLVRHGQTATTGKVLPGRAPGLHLAETGQEQARRAAERLAKLRIDAVYASPLERTRETAAPIAKATGHRVRTAKGLLECDFGEWTGAELSALRKLPEWRQVQSTPSTFRFPGGESFLDMQRRIWDEIERLVALHPGGTVVAVSHADPIKAAVAMATGVHLDLFQRIVISPCSVTPLSIPARASGGAGPIVLAVNSTGDDLSTLAPS